MIVDHTNVGAAFRRLSLPLAVQMLGDQLLGVVDTIVIGALGAASLAGVTGAATVFFTLIMTLGGLWSGAGIIAAQRIGPHDVDGFARTVRAGFAIPGLAAVAITLASFFGAYPLLHAMAPALPTLQASALYLICAALR